MLFLEGNNIRFSLLDPNNSKNKGHATIMNYNSHMKTAQIKFNALTVEEFVNELGVNDYEKYTQPCSECWDDCPPVEDSNSTK